MDLFLQKFKKDFIFDSEIPKDPLKAILSELKCHFTWNLLKEDILFDIENTIGQQLEFVTTESRLTLYNILAYVKLLKGQHEDALECLEQAEDLIGESTRTKKKCDVWSLGETMLGRIITWTSLRKLRSI